MPITIKKKRKTNIPGDVIEALKHRIVKDHDRDYDETSALREKRKHYLKQWEGVLPREKPHEEWESTISLPITYTESEIVATRIDQAVTENQIVVMKPTGEEDIELTAKKEKWFNWLCRNYITDFFGTIDRASNTHTRMGNNIFYSYYERKVEPILYSKEFRLEEQDTFDDYSFITKCLGIIETEYGESLMEMPIEIGEYKWKVKYKRKAPIDSILDEIDDYVTLDFYPKGNKLEVVIEENKIEYDGVRFKNISLDKVWFPSSVKTNEELQTCNHAGIEFETDYSAIARNQKDKVYDLLTDDDLKIFKKTPVAEKDAKTTHITTETEENAGIKPSSETDESANIPLWECYYFYDINNDGYDEKIIVTYFPEQKKIARIKRLNKVFRHGQRPLDISEYSIRENTIFALGVCEILNQVQEEIDVLHNQFINWNTAATVPFGLVRLGSNIAKNLEKKEIKIKPRTLFPVDDVDDIKFPYVPNNQGWAMQDIGLLISHGHDAVGTSDAMRGREQHSRTPVGSTLKLLAEANIRIKQGLIRFNRALKSHLKKIYQLQRDYGPDKQTFRIMGTDGEFQFQEISREDLKILPDFDLGTSLDNLNKIFMRETWLLLIQTVINPFLIQVGVIQPQGIYEHLRKLYEVYDIKDYQKLITKPIQNPLIDQEQEMTRMMGGEYMAVNPMDDDRDHMQVIDEWMKDDIKAGSIASEYMHLVVSHREAHQMGLMQKENAIRQQSQDLMMQQQQQQGLPGVSGAQQRPKTNPMMPPGGQPRT